MKQQVKLRCGNDPNADENTSLALEKHNASLKTKESEVLPTLPTDRFSDIF